MLKFRNIFCKKSMVFSTVFVAIINGDEHSFVSKDSMMKYIKDYGSENVIHSLSMFKNVIYSII